METIVSLKKEGFVLDDYVSFALVSDIGGTKTPLSYFGKKNDGTIIEIFTLLWKSADISDFSECINSALALAYNDYRITAERTTAAFGVAGPIERNREFSRPTNLKWSIDADSIRKGTYLKRIVLLNDFEAAGFGVDLLLEDDLEQLNRVKRKEGNAAIIGAGTGLGMGMLKYDSKKGLYLPLPSEGGHMAAALESEEDLGMARSMMQDKGYSAMPGFEAFVSGPGILNIYDYLSRKDIRKNAVVENADDKAAAIAGQAKADPVCRKTIDTFLRIYGRAASALALAAYSKGGIFIAGGIAPKLIDEMKNGIFLAEFQKNYRLGDFLKSIPVFVVTNEKAALLGAANAAFNFYDELKE